MPNQSIVSGIIPKRDFSLKMRKVKAKTARVQKYKLKTKKAFQKRFDIVRLKIHSDYIY